MKEETEAILEEYLSLFPEEQNRLSVLINYMSNYEDEEIIDWNNFDGHIVASGFIYAKEENKFLVIYHNDFKIYLYPGGHVDSNDINILEAAKREIKEETGLVNLSQLKLIENNLIPVDIDIHKIGYNERLNLPEHYHFDFRYIFTVDRVTDIKIDTTEISNYKWIDAEKLLNDPNYNIISNKIKKLINKL